MLGLVTLSTDLHSDKQCPNGPEMLANLHGSPIKHGNSDRPLRMNGESNNREMVNSSSEILNADFTRLRLQPETISSNSRFGPQGRFI
ncbi:hypothetical protein PVL29_019456 [Vitis rotundifolia]|uniref:Uncharacterized protein n=1 Tax=Vitis rotundifolia TaxID=103349 RepID=A0AA39DCR1_VITRO|nr:hypothetical protein PVL29_019456 [Vitis rotundifolia]